MTENEGASAGNRSRKRKKRQRLNLSSSNSQDLMSHDVYDPNAEANFLDIAVQS